MLGCRMPDIRGAHEGMSHLQEGLPCLLLPACHAYLLQQDKPGTAESQSNNKPRSNAIVRHSTITEMTE